MTKSYPFRVVTKSEKTTILGGPIFGLLHVFLSASSIHGRGGEYGQN